MEANRSKMAIFVIFVVAMFLPGGRTQQDKIIIGYAMPEEYPAMTFIGEIPKDADLAQIYTVDELENTLYSILDDQKYADFVSIDAQSGVLQTAGVIDREEICPGEETCIINIDIGVQPADDFLLVQIEIAIDDINDKAPKFLQSSISKSISENTSPGTSYRMDAAEDSDSPKYGVSRYILKEGAPVFDLEVTEAEGSFSVYLVLKQSLDREIADHYSAVITAYDGGTPPKSGDLTIDITVLDVNDNDPRFEQEIYQATVPEDTPPSTVIIQVKATDPDLGTNGQIVYGFDTKTQHLYSQLFVINNATGEIAVKDTLDYEEETGYNLAVTARDKNPDSVEVVARVIVEVSDVNDHEPKITVNALTTTGHVEILEGKPEQTFVAHVAVEDKDSGRDGTFLCNLEGDAFEVQQLNPTAFKIVTARVLDREVVATYDLIFVCWDQGESPKSSSAHIPVTILDVNDNAPEFTQSTYSISLEENNAVGGFLAQVSAVDGDDGANGEVEYRVVGSGINFIKVDPISGNVTAKVSFDYEQGDRQQFTILAIDHGAPPLSSTSLIHLKFTDVDDSYPEFSSKQYSFDVYENQPMGTEVGQVAATDDDSPPFNEFLFFLDSDAIHTDTFVIEPQNGKIFTSRTLDRESKSTYQLTVLAIAKNTRDMTSTSMVVVYVADKNDNNPVVYFPNMHNNTVYIASNTDIGSRVTHIIAADVDIGINGELSFMIKDGNEEEFFYIDQETGIIKTRADLHHLDTKIFQLTLTVHDNGYPRHSVEVTLNIVVNKSVEDPGLSRQNLNIVISVVTVSTFLTAFLVAAIFVVRRQDRLSSKRAQYDNKVILGPGVVTSGVKSTEVSALTTVHNEISNSGYSNRAATGDENGPIYAVSQKKSSSSQPSHKQDMHSHSTYVQFGPASHPFQMPSQSRTPSLDCHALAMAAPRSPRTSSSNQDMLPSSSAHHALYHPQHTQQAPGSVMKDPDTESDSSAALSNADSGRGSNEDTTESALSQSREEVILQAAVHAGTPPKKPPRSSQGSSSESFKARLSNVVQMQNHHIKHGINDNTTSSSSNPSSSSGHHTNYSRPPPKRTPPVGESRFSDTPPVIPPKRSDAQRLQPNSGHRNNGSYGGSHSNHNGVHGNLKNANIRSSHATLNSTWAESEEDYSDEDQEYVYYVNASQV